MVRMFLDSDCLGAFIMISGFSLQTPQDQPCVERRMSEVDITSPIVADLRLPR